jgi:hypothetical protein
MRRDLGGGALVRRVVRVRKAEHVRAFALDHARGAAPLPDACQVVRPSGKRGVTTSSTNDDHSASETVPPPGMPVPK